MQVILEKSLHQLLRRLALFGQFGMCHQEPRLHWMGTELSLIPHGPGLRTGMAQKLISFLVHILRGKKNQTNNSMTLKKILC